MQPGMAPLPPPQQAEGEQGGKQKKDGPQLGGPPGMQPGMAPLPPPHEAQGQRANQREVRRRERRGGHRVARGPFFLRMGRALLLISSADE